MTRKFGYMVLLCALLMGCSSTPTQESTGEFIDNTLITAKIKAQLLDDNDINSTKISVNSHKGTVTLTGRVQLLRQKLKAGKIAAGINGVKKVVNQLIVEVAQ